jgi:DnaJ domain
MKSTLTIQKLKEKVYLKFKVKNTSELKKSGLFKLSIDGMDKLDLRYKKTWEILYRKFVGVLPYEENQEGYGCINGINIFDYFDPWTVFELDPDTATDQDIKTAYYRLSKIYHPDVKKTGDSKIFNRINQMYRTIIAEA